MGKAVPPPIDNDKSDRLKQRKHETIRILIGRSGTGPEHIVHWPRKPRTARSDAEGGTRIAPLRRGSGTRPDRYRHGRRNGWTHSIPEDAGWLTATRDGDRLSVSVADNADETDRSASITLNASAEGVEPVKITVRQEAAEAPNRKSLRSRYRPRSSSSPLRRHRDRR